MVGNVAVLDAIGQRDRAQWVNYPDHVKILPLSLPPHLCCSNQCHLPSYHQNLEYFPNPTLIKDLSLSLSLSLSLPPSTFQIYHLPSSIFSSHRPKIEKTIKIFDKIPAETTAAQCSQNNATFSSENYP